MTVDWIETFICSYNHFGNIRRFDRLAFLQIVYRCSEKSLYARQIQVANHRLWLSLFINKLSINKSHNKEVSCVLGTQSIIIQSSFPACFVAAY